MRLVSGLRAARLLAEGASTIAECHKCIGMLNPSRSIIDPTTLSRLHVESILLNRAARDVLVY